MEFFLVVLFMCAIAGVVGVALEELCHRIENK
jgi:hypothetical protein